MSQTTTYQQVVTYPAPRHVRARDTYIPVWRRRQLAELQANGGRIIARTVSAGGTDVAL